jgi:ABC-2 type transport system ATP-binding protein
LSEVEQIVDHIGIIANGVLGYQDAVTPGQNLEELFMQVVAMNQKAGE